MPEFKGSVAAVETAPFWDYAMEALLPKKDELNSRLAAAHVITKDGVMEAPDAGMPGWQPVGSPRPEDRIWRFISFDPEKETELLPKAEKKRFRDVTLPAGLEGWYQPGFDDSKWHSGKAPIGTGVWTQRNAGAAPVKYQSDWGGGEFLLMRTTFEADNLDYESFRLSILARQGFHVYLNGHRIDTYGWWQDDPHYRPVALAPGHINYLKKGVNVLAAYANVQYDGPTQAPQAAIDLTIEGITKEGMTYVNSKEYLQKQMDKVCTRAEQRIIGGASNGGYHYLGSAKIMAQIGKAFAEATLEMERK
jgi:hypothetical protein